MSLLSAVSAQYILLCLTILVILKQVAVKRDRVDTIVSFNK